MVTPRTVLAGAVALTCSALACSHPGRFVWVDDYGDPPVQQEHGYTIAPGDLLAVRVWNQEAMSAKARVRSDGMISLPFVNDVEASGIEPELLARRVEAKLKGVVVKPVVTVAVEEPAPFEISVLGEVSRPGVYRVDRQATVVTVLASAGGLTAIAARDGIYVLRRPAADPAATPVRIRFTYRALTRVEGSAATFRIAPGDAVVVE